MAANGDIYKDSYSGWYSVRDEAYYAESETEVRGDGVRYGPQGTPVDWVEEESYFFRLSAYQEPLLKHYRDNPDFIGPDERRNEIVSFVSGGLKDLSVSRTTFDWGVKVPDDPAHVMYVWVDALTNYITGVGFPDEDDPNWRYWPADLHVIGKDITRFHTVYWPAFLMAAGIDVPIVPGIVPVVNFRQTAGFAAKTGASIPDWLARRFEGLDDDPVTRQLVAAAVAAEQVLDLVDRGFRDFHFYTMNRADLVYAICHLLGLRPRSADSRAAA